MSKECADRVSDYQPICQATKDPETELILHRVRQQSGPVCFQKLVSVDPRKKWRAFGRIHKLMGWTHLANASVPSD